MSNAQNIINLLENVNKPVQRGLKENEGDDCDFSISGTDSRELHNDLKRKSRHLTPDQKAVAESILDVVTEIMWAASTKSSQRRQNYDGTDDPFCTMFVGADIDFVSLDNDHPSFSVRASLVANSNPSKENVQSLRREISNYYDSENITPKYFEEVISKGGEFHKEWQDLKEKTACDNIELLNDYIEDYIHHHNLSFGEGEFEFEKPEKDGDDYITNFRYISY